MNEYVALLLTAAIGYLLGSVSTGILYSRALGRDIRTQGSKNAGATNMTRVHGLAKGLLTFGGDCLKGVLAALIGKWLGGQLGACVGGTFAVFGHMWPVFFGFKGGKGVATCIGIGLVTYPLFGLLANALSRRAEFRADAQAVKEGCGDALVSALRKLARENFADLAPSPLLVKLEYSHPTLSQRIAAIEKKG